MIDDPLIQGPKPESASGSSSGHSRAAHFDLESTTPPQDFVNMIRNPAKFFESIPALPRPLLIAKAFVGAVAMVMLAKFASSGFRLDARFEGLDTIVPQLLKSLDIQNPMMGPLIEKGMDHLKGGMALFGHLALLLVPVFLISDLLMKSLSLRIFLPLMSSVTADRVTLRRMIVILSFPKWLSIFGFLPYSGWAVSLVVFVFTINALRSTFNLPWFKIFLAYVLFDILIKMLLAALIAVFLVTLTMA